MDRLLLVLGGMAVAGLVVALLPRRTAAPAANTHHIPRQLNRADFDFPDVPWLVVVFTSSTCTSCAGVVERARHLASDEVAVIDMEVTRDKRLHDRYKIDAVPTLVICDAEGIVKRAFVGPTTATDLWAAVAAAREPGSVPPGCTVGDL